MRNDVWGRPLVLLRRCLLGVLLVSVSFGTAGCGDQGPPITAARLAEAAQAMRTMVKETARGRVDAGENAFWKADPFFHDVDPLLREKDWRLAVSLWNSMLQIELQYAGERDPEVLLKEGRNALRLLPEVAEVLDLEAHE